MPNQKILEKNLLDLSQFTAEKTDSLFYLVKKLKTSPPQKHSHWKTTGSAALLFFEPSTRTRMSFETAAHRMGMQTVLLDGAQGTSLEKGESFEDTILNVAAMQPELLVIRSGANLNLKNMAERVALDFGLPVLNAGWGAEGHPTQALLDAFTISENFKTFKDLKILFIGDIKHSRVAASHFELLPKLGANVATCAPDFLMHPKVTQNFSNLKEALSWADVVICLRVQLERHASELNFVKEDFVAQFGLTAQNLGSVKPSAIIMHPGPINHGVELASEVLSDPRCKVLKQVTNGVFVREAVMRIALGINL